MNVKRIIRTIQTLAVCSGIIIVSLKSSPLTEAKRFGNYFLEISGLKEYEKNPSMTKLDNDYVDSLWKKQSLIEINGTMAKTLGMKGLYSNIGMYITDDNYIVSASAQTSTDYEYKELISFYEYLQNKGIHLLYVNEPTKYIDDSIFKQQFGIESYSNRNADHFLQRISEVGIPFIDLREELIKDNLNINDMFYRTDHHWTTKSALWASAKIAEGLNSYCNYNIDLSIFDEDQYKYKEYHNSWLGEQGRKIGKSYVGLDDFLKITPKFETDYIFKSTGKHGDFSDFINNKIYKSKKDVYNVRSWHYSYSQKDVINNNIDYGKLLILGDSYEQVTEPFLSLCLSETDSIIMRNHKGSIRDYIDQHDYDTVIICYAQFMIGAHDNPSSANYRMFDFE